MKNYTPPDVAKIIETHPNNVLSYKKLEYISIAQRSKISNIRRDIDGERILSFKRL